MTGSAASGAKENCAWIGVGRMGYPLCNRLISAGHPLWCFDPDPKAVSRIVDRGAEALASAFEAATVSDIVFCMVPDDQALAQVVLGETGIAASLGAGKLFVDLSTVSADASAKVAAAIASAGGAYLRCPVSGSTANADDGTLTLFVSGPEDQYRRIEPVLGRIAAKQFYFGAAEEARVVKLMVNMLVSVMPALIGEAIAFGTAQGLSRDAAIEAINNSVVATPLSGYKAEMLRSKDWTAMASVDLVAKDVDLALAMARANQVPMPFTALARQFSAMLQSQRQGGRDFFLVSTWPEWSAGSD